MDERAEPGRLPFRRPWRELAPVIWAAYVVGIPSITLMEVPVSLVTNPYVLWTEFLRTAVGVLLGLGALHFSYAVVVPRLPTWRPAFHALVLGVSIVFGCEVSRLVVGRPGESGYVFRLQYYRFAFVDAAILIACLLVYDWMRARAANLEKEKDLAAREARLAQLEALQVRTEPHFLFNALNSVACLIQVDARKATAAVERMSELYRFMLDASQKATVPLSAELDVVRGYLEIESLRYEGLRFDIAVQPGAGAVGVPPLMVQPIVENAVKHGVARATGEGRIRVFAQTESGRLSIRVENSQGGSAHDQNGAGRSLGLIRERLRLAYGDEALFEHGPREGGDYVALLQLPVRLGGG